MPRKMRRAALRSALSVKAGNGDIIVLDAIGMDAPKTKEIVTMMNRLTQGNSTLLLLAGHDNNVELSARNAADVKALLANYLNIRDLLGFEKLVVPLDALQVIETFLSVDADLIMESDGTDEEE
ncbi:MAG: 50S ribosomal protein L4 [Chloroflexi bacterium]|nr:50S ribosomal protein L4 [Chloroflexota bacterium]